ncbi:MAG: 50S ribosomal protein L3 [Planctomycetes bacterium]|nr:50S ribosomal protein L3 [Planctomycetota bacterium]
MTQIHDDEGRLLPVTVIEAGPCVVLALRTRDREGYDAVQIGFDDKPRKRAIRSERGHVAAIQSKRQRQRQAAGVEAPPRADCEPKRFIREFRTDGEDHGLEIGQTLGPALFDGVTFVDVIGTNKGRGFAGVMKRHNFSGQGASHGVKRVHRHPGSIGMSADPSRVFKGTRMAGHYGNARNTMRHLRVVRIEQDSNLLLVKGAVPGPVGGYVMIRHTTKRRRKAGEGTTS